MIQNTEQSFVKQPLTVPSTPTSFGQRSLTDWRKSEFSRASPAAPSYDTPVPQTLAAPPPIEPPVQRPTAKGEARRTVRPLSHPRGESLLQLSDVIYEPVVAVGVAAVILGVSVDLMEKWRQRGVGPDYIKYQGGAVRYVLSKLNEYRAAHTVRTRVKK